MMLICCGLTGEGSSNRNYNDAQGDGNYNNEDDADIFFAANIFDKESISATQRFPP